MPLTTKNYKLNAFLRGEPYSASTDQSRFTIVDNHLRWLSENAGNGVIAGWNMSGTGSSSNISITVSDGMGIIDSVVTRTFGDLTVSLSDNSTTYLYMQKKKDMLGGGGTFSNIAVVYFNDMIPPSAPTNLTSTEALYNSITLDWDDNTEEDLSHYEIFRDGVYAGRSTVSSYVDTGLLEQTTYSYRVFAIDISGNESPQSNLIAISTDMDLTIPTNPSYPFAIEGDGYIQLAWEAPDFGNAVRYYIEVHDITNGDCSGALLTGLSWYSLTVIEWVELTPEQWAEMGIFYTGNAPIPFGNYSTTETQITINGLENSHYYLFTLHSVTPNGVNSVGVTKTLIPRTTLGPDEVNNLSVSEAISQNNPRGINLSIAWTPGASPYKPLAEKFCVTLVENGTVVSDPIYVFNATSLNIDTYPYGGFSRPILSDCYYIIKVQAVDDNDNHNSGIITSISTSKFYAPAAPSAINVKLTPEKDLLFVWKNSLDEFSYNYITITKTDMNTGEINEILLKSNYGKKRSYKINAPLDFYSRYIIYLQAVDSFGNESIQSVMSYTTEEESTLNNPIPNDQYAFSSDGSVLIIWRDATPEIAAYYKIWRAFYSTNILASHFSLIDTVPATRQFFVDYSAENSYKYYYFVTKVDIYGNESKNPIDDEYHYYPLCYTYPHTNNIMTPVGGLDAVNSELPNDFDVVLQWDTSSDSFDGYEIYKSQLNQYSWAKIGYTEKNIGSYIDSGGLLYGSGSYYYMVRKFKNEARLVTSYSQVAPISSVPLAKIVTLFGAISIEDLRDDISSLSSVVETYLDEQIEDHHHSLTAGWDRRVDLLGNVIISNWYTRDHKIFTTNDDFSGATSYIVKINGEIPSTFYEIDEDLKEIIFAELIPSSASITLECVGLSETSGSVPTWDVNNVFSSIVDDVSATQAQTSYFRDLQLETINHAGRTGEELVPLQLTTKTENGYLFSIYQNDNSTTQESIGGSWTFYDIDMATIDSSMCWQVFTVAEWLDFSADEWGLFVVDCPECIYATTNKCVTRLIAATSNGVLASTNMGESWSQVLETSSPVHRIYHAPTSDRVFAVTNSDVYVSGSGVTWAKTEGLNNVGMIRDIIEDGIENIFVSTDLGVYILKELSLGDYLAWEQTAIIDDETSNVYGLLLDTSSPYITNRIIASAEVGLFETTNYGATWSYISDLTEQLPFYQFAAHNSNIFALSNDSVWRKSPADIYYSRIISIDADEAIKFIIYEDRILISTSEGLMITKSNYDIDYSLDIQLEPGLPIINFSSKITPVTSLNSTAPMLLIGTDQMVFSGESLSDISLLYSRTTGIIPTIFIDGKEKKLGAFYDINNNLVSFYNIVDVDSTVTVANQYVVYRSSNDGWVDQSYGSDFTLKQNGSVIGSFTAPTIDDVIVSLSAVSFETFTESNSNSATAIEYSNDYSTDLLRLTNVNIGSASLNTGETIQDLVSQVVDDYNKTYSQVIGKIRFGSIVEINSQNYTVLGFERILFNLTDSLWPDYEIFSTIPSVTTTENIGTVNISDGMVIFASTFNKYDIIRIDIEGTSLKNSGTNTHTDIDDTMDYVNTGLPASLTDVHHSNILKTELFIDRTLEDLSSVSNNTYNTYYVSPILSSSIDTLNSTVGYHVEMENPDVSFVVKYPTAVSYITSGDRVVVGDDNGLISISTIDYSLSAIVFNEFEDDEFVRDMYYDSSDDIAYLLTSYNLYTSSDGGATWSRVWLKGLSAEFRKITVIRDNIIIATNDGIYYKSPLNDGWVRSATYSDATILFPSNLLYMVSDNHLYYSYDGRSGWVDGGSFGDINVNAMTRYRCEISMATNSGYRLGIGTFNGNDVQGSLVDLAGNISQSEAFKFNDIATNSVDEASLGADLVLGANDGTYWIVNDTSYTQYADSLLTCIHKVLYVGSNYWLFGFDNLKLPGVTEPIKLSVGAAF